MSPQTDQTSYSWVADYAPLIVLLVLVAAGVLMLRSYKRVPRKPGDGFDWSTFLTGDSGSSSSSSSSSDPNVHQGQHHAGSYHSSHGFDAGGHHGGGFDGASHGGGFDGGGGHH